MDVVKDIKVEGINIFEREKAWFLTDRVDHDDDKVYFKVIESKRRESIGDLQV